MPQTRFQEISGAFYSHRRSLDGLSWELIQRSEQDANCVFVIHKVSSSLLSGLLCEICVGMVLETSVIHPHDAQARRRQVAAANFVDLVLQYNVEAIALGDGVGSKETETFISNTLKAAGLTVGWAIVSEDGASVYSASELASQELPEMDVSLRGAASIARRLQDPLAELVKVSILEMNCAEFVG